jgi:hypothetical protein
VAVTEVICIQPHLTGVRERIFGFFVYFVEATCWLGSQTASTSITFGTPPLEAPCAAIL